jgi:long-chain acyl-CoA synthetase
MPADTIVARLFAQARTRPNQAAYFVRESKDWRGFTWRQYADNVRRAAKALIALGVPARSTVCILGYNRPEWVLMDLACMAIGSAPAGIYTTCSPEEVRYILHHAESPVVLVENEAQWSKIARERDHLPLLRHVVIMQGAPRIDDRLVLSWDEFLARNRSWLRR